MNPFIFLGIILALTILCAIFLNNQENWSWTYSGWPGPLESSSRSNIPALYGNPKYESPCHYSFGLSKGHYIMKKQYPNN